MDTNNIRLICFCLFHKRKEGFGRLLYNLLNFKKLCLMSLFHLEEVVKTIIYSINKIFLNKDIFPSFSCRKIYLLKHSSFVRIYPVNCRSAGIVTHYQSNLSLTLPLLPNLLHHSTQLRQLLYEKDRIRTKTLDLQSLRLGCRSRCKGKVLDWELEAVSLKPNDVFPLYIGDDITDEALSGQLKIIALA